MPYDIVRQLLEVVTSQNRGGPRHVTPSTSFSALRQSGGNAPSGSYAECDTSASSISTLAHPLFQNRGVAGAEISRDVSGHVTRRNDVVDGGDVTEDAYQSPVSPVCGPRHREQPLSKGSGLKRQVAPCSPHCSPPLARSTWDRKPRPVSPLHVQISPVTSRNQRRSLSPPSPTLQRLPKAPSPPRDCYRARAVPGEEEEEEDGEQSSESGSRGSSWEEEEEVVACPETAREAEAGALDGNHLGVLEESPVRLQESPVSLQDSQVRLDSGPVSIRGGQVRLSDQHVDPTYFTPV